MFHKKTYIFECIYSYLSPVIASAGLLARFRLNDTNNMQYISELDNPTKIAIDHILILNYSLIVLFIIRYCINDNLKNFIYRLIVALSTYMNSKTRWTYSVSYQILIFKLASLFQNVEVFCAIGSSDVCKLLFHQTASPSFKMSFIYIYCTRVILSSGHSW